MSDWLTADDIICIIDDIVHKHGRDAFAHHGHTHLYSGPAQDIKDQFIDTKINNHERARTRSQQLGAVMIDNTLVGQFLMNFKGYGNTVIKGKGTFDYFIAKPNLKKLERYQQARYPWQYASRYFALNSWGHITTSVCGASDKSVYNTLEVPYTIDPKHQSDMLPKLKETTRLIFLPRKKPLDFVNMLPYGKIDRIYDPRDWKQAGKVICLGEIRMAKHDALSGVKREKIREGIKLAARDVLSRPIEIYKYYLESRECYRLDRQRIKKETTNKPRKSQTETPETRTKNRHQSLKEFGVIALHAVKAEIELLPKAERPTIEPFELSNGRLKLAV